MLHGCCTAACSSQQKGRELVGQVSGKHTTYVEGGRDLASQLADLRCVKKVWPGPITGRSARKRKLTVCLTRRSVEVALGAGDGHQSFYCYPKPGVTMGQLFQAVRAKLGGRLTNIEDEQTGATETHHPADEPAAEMNSAVPLPSEEAETGTEDAGALPPLPPPPQDVPMVKLKYLLKITVQEAQALVSEFEKGMPAEFARGASVRIGQDLWNALRSHDYITTVGRGRGGARRSGTRKIRPDALRGH